MNRAHCLFLSSVAFVLASCGGDSPVTIGGTVTGLAGTGLVLTNNGSDDLTVTANGPFTFATAVAKGQPYVIGVKTQPTNPAQTCSVSGGTGTAGIEDITTISLSCQTQTFHVSGTITGLAGGNLMIQNSGGDNLSISADGAFTFAAPVASGATYAVTVLSQPSGPTQVCTVANGTGTITNADVTDVAISCVTSKFTIGGTATGVAGTGLVLQNNAGDNLSIAADGSFVFATSIASGATYAVTVLSQPSGPTQTCTVLGGTGTVGGGNVTSVAVNCMTNRYTISGTISGLGAAATLQNNAGDDLTVTANGSFAFATPIASGATYNVSVLTQPTAPWQTCTVGAGTGTVTNANVMNVVVTCTTNTYSIGGMITGLAAGDSVVLRNNGGNNLTRSVNGAFTFTTNVASGQSYNVTVFTNPVSPIAQTCTVANGSGMVGGSNVTNVAVTCTTNSYTVTATVSGMTGTGMVLRNNGGDDRTINANGSYPFATALASGSTYSVTIATQPSGATCAIGNPTGTVGASNVNVVVTCGAKTWSTALFPLAVPGPTVGCGDMTFDANGDLLVVASRPTNAIVRVNRVTGAQTTIATGITPSTSYLLGVAYSAANDTIYTHNDLGTIYAVTNTGTVSVLTTYSSAMNAIVIAPSTFGAYGGYIIAATNTSAVVAINPVGGAVTTLSSATSISDLAFAPDGTLYVSGGALVRTISSTGVVATFSTGFNAADGITISPDGTRMFIADSGTDTVRQATIPGAVITTVGSYDIDDGFFVGGILADPGNTVIVMTGESSLTLRAFSY
ncbi:MAG: hypothetical protein JWO36_5481 [Myxococcales bacterium]|nr:hypothetical protein [Myxococcales bacterium]